VGKEVEDDDVERRVWLYDDDIRQSSFIHLLVTSTRPSTCCNVH
jgi:hypothetical protein